MNGRSTSAGIQPVEPALGAQVQTQAGTSQCMAGEAGSNSNLKVVRYEDLKKATDKFRSVVSGNMFNGRVKEVNTLAPPDVAIGTPVAVKRFNRGSEEDNKTWQNEKNLERPPHENLVKLLGYCDENKKKAFLVYEFVPNGSVPNHLFKKFLRESLTWDNRLNIAIGAARGLSFLHSLGIVHRDIKPTTIMLDKDFNAKISNFHSAIKKSADGEIPPPVTNGEIPPICGTVGYIDPEYMITGKFSTKSDVYSFGVVLLQILTGLTACDYSHPQERLSLVDWAIPLLSHKTKLQTIVDADNNLYISQKARETAILVQKCLCRDPSERPSMEDVVKDLERIQTIQTPAQ